MASFFFILVSSSSTYLLLLLTYLPFSYCTAVMKEGSVEALFVFGDSYADTGNHDHLELIINKPWKRPYGCTWPGRPSGRFSNGRVLTDFFAAHLGIESPLPYRVIEKKIKEHGNNRHVRQVAGRGINFAYGGSGVFPTFGPQYTNISTQIDQLRACVGKGLVKLSSSSIALLVVAGNDYTIYGLLNPGEKGIYNFIAKVVDEIVSCIELLHKLGFRRVAVTNLEPFGCFPGVTYLNNYTSCDEKQNQESGYHNKLLANQMLKLQARLPKLNVWTLDLEHAFLLSLQENFNDRRLQWRSCCEAREGHSCGDVDTEGEALYTVCSNPDMAVYWDDVHPTDFGWECISNFLFSSSGKL